MKNTLILFALLGTAMLSAQVSNIQPEAVYTFPDLHPDSLAKYQALHEAYLEIGEPPYSEAEEQLLELEWQIIQSPYEVGEVGCSWYCGGDVADMSASSTLPAGRISNYEPANAHDFDLRTAWVEGDDGLGIGSTLHYDFEFTGRLGVNKIIIYNGYCKSLATWQKNARIRTLLVTANGAQIGVLHLEDTYFGQVFPITTQHGDINGDLRLSFTIQSVYPGTEFEDTGISELYFDGVGVH